ncbi:N-acetylmuramoyl-L-alanine amidase, partial [Candidatus Hakubella thermalkaliphila]
SRVVINTGSQSRGVKDGAFFVLTHTTMPAALQEGEFISNPDKEALLRTDAFRDKIAQGIFEGIVNFLNEYGAATISPTNYTYWRNSSHAEGPSLHTRPLLGEAGYSLMHQIEGNGEVTRGGRGLDGSSELYYLPPGPHFGAEGSAGR